MQFSFSKWLGLIKADKLIWRGARTTLGLVLAIAASVWWIDGRVPPEIPLWYSRPWGERQLAGRQVLWFLAGGLGGAGILTLIMGRALLVGQKTVARIVVWTAVLIEALGFLAVWNIWWRVRA